MRKVKLKVVTEKEIYIGAVSLEEGGFDIYSWFRERNEMDGEREFLEIEPEDGGENILIRNSSIISIQPIGKPL